METNGMRKLAWNLAVVIVVGLPLSVGVSAAVALQGAGGVPSTRPVGALRDGAGRDDSTPSWCARPLTRGRGVDGARRRPAAVEQRRASGDAGGASAGERPGLPSSPEHGARERATLRDD